MIENTTVLQEEVARLRSTLGQREQINVILEGLVESLADGVVALDFRGEITHVSDDLRDTEAEDPQMTLALADGNDGMLPTEILELLRSETADLEPSAVERFELTWDRSDLGRRIYEVIATQGAESVEDRSLTIFAFHDVTEQRAMKTEMERTQDLATLGQMAATVAHELRNPLAAIQGFATLLERDLSENTRAQRQIDRILQGVDGANRIIEDLLEYSREVRLTPEPVSVESLLAESIAALQISPRWSDKIDLDMAIDPGVLPCRGDRRRLLQVLANLYNNAVDAMDSGGTLSIRVRRAGGFGDSERVRLVIRDSGCGLSAEEVARIFDPFYTSKPGGTGLGMSIVRRIIEAHEGSVHVVSAPGRGTSVVIDLPVSVSTIGPASTEREAA